MIKPTIGRVLWFYQHADIMQPAPVFVTYVHSDAMVNVAGFTNNGEPFKQNSCTLVQEGQDLPQAGFYATWMPYQQQQAKKEN